MLAFARWKYFIIVVVVILSIIYALPNGYRKLPGVQVTANHGVVDAALTQRISSLLRKNNIQFASVQLEKKSVLVRLTDLQEQTRANDVLLGQLGDDYTVALNLISTVPQWLTTIGAKPMVQGLDLVGGVHFTLKIDRASFWNTRLDAFAEEMRSVLDEQHILYRNVSRQGQNGLSLAIVFDNRADAAMRQRALGLLQNYFSGFVLHPQPGADLIVARPSEGLEQDLIRGAVEQNIMTLRNRINSLGVAEPIIQRQGEDSIAVQLPEVQDTAEAKRMIGATATLEFRGVVEGDAAEALRTGNIPPQARIYMVRGTQTPILLNKRVISSGNEMINATLGTDENGMPAVNVTLNSTAGARMLDYTQTHLGKLMSVVYIESIPSVRIVNGKEVVQTITKEEALPPTRIAAVFGSQFRTTGLDKTEAENLVKLLRSGSLAAPMNIVEERVIGPSLGAENVARGVTAVVFAFIFTLVFFAVYYRIFGVITSISLFLSLLIVVSLLSICGSTMTLPGFAGLALSIGLSVDANVLINERIREELRAGMPAKAAIATGYDKATGTILDANLAGIIAGVALYAFGTGPLKGFAITLVVGILASMFTAITVSRALVTLLYARRQKLKHIAI